MCEMTFFFFQLWCKLRRSYLEKFSKNFFKGLKRWTLRVLESNYYLERKKFQKAYKKAVLDGYYLGELKFLWKMGIKILFSMATTWGKKIFCKKWRFFAILAGYYLRRKILQKKIVCSKWTLENYRAKTYRWKKVKLFDDKVGWVAETHPTLPEWSRV